MDYFPIFLDLKGRRALIVGGGEAAARKLRLLRKAGAEITVVASRPGAEIEESGARLRAPRLRCRRCQRPRNRVCRLGRRGSRRSRRRGGGRGRRSVQRSRPGRCFQLHRAGHRRTRSGRDRHFQRRRGAGAGPASARSDRAAAAGAPGPLARFADSFRGAIKGLLPDAASRRRFWERFFDSAIAEAILAGDDSKAREGMLTLVNRKAANDSPKRASFISSAPVRATPIF